MDARKFGGIGVVTMALAIGGVVVFTQPGQTQEQKVAHVEHDEAMQACATACSNCQRACDACTTQCAHLSAEGKKEYVTILMSCHEYATICAVASHIVSRDGPHSVLICECCAKACDQCGTACETFPSDKHMKSCAEECRKCEQSCQAMIKHMGTK